MNRTEKFVQDHPRAFGWIMAAMGAAVWWYEWYAIRHERLYSPIASVAGPFCAILFMGLQVLPWKATPNGKRRKLMLQVLMVVGLLVGSLNWYAMTHL